MPDLNTMLLEVSQLAASQLVKQHLLAMLTNTFAPLLFLFA